MDEAIYLYNGTMSGRAKVVFERGKFFIQTGTARSFRHWLLQSDEKLIRELPTVIIKRITDLINKGDIDAATTLWMHACRNAEALPMKRVIAFTIGAYLLVVGAMSVYSFVNLFLN